MFCFLSLHLLVSFSFSPRSTCSTCRLWTRGPRRPTWSIGLTPTATLAVTGTTDTLSDDVSPLLLSTLTVRAWTFLNVCLSSHTFLLLSLSHVSSNNCIFSCNPLHSYSPASTLLMLRSCGFAPLPILYSFFCAAGNLKNLSNSFRAELSLFLNTGRCLNLFRQW